MNQRTKSRIVNLLYKTPPKETPKKIVTPAKKQPKHPK